MSKKIPIGKRFETLRKSKKDKYGKDMPTTQLAEELLNKKYISNYTPNAIRQEISKVENENKIPQLYLIEGYCKYFKVTSDYLLGISENKYADENYQMITRTTGLSDNSISNLKKMHNGNNTDDFFKTLNMLIGTDFELFTTFIDAINLYFDDSFNTSMTISNNVFKPINNLSDTILNNTENLLYIGSYDNKLCNGTGGYYVKGLPISLLKEAYSLHAIETILEELKKRSDKE